MDNFQIEEFLTHKPPKSAPACMHVQYSSYIV